MFQTKISIQTISKTLDGTEVKDEASDALGTKMNIAMDSATDAMDEAFKKMGDIFKDIPLETSKATSIDVIEVYGATKEAALSEASSKGVQGYKLQKVYEKPDAGVWIAELKRVLEVKL